MYGGVGRKDEDGGSNMLRDNGYRQYLIFILLWIFFQSLYKG